MMLIITCVRGVPGKFDINGAVWCILSVPKLDIFNLKINIFFDDKSTTKILCHFFSKINPDGHFGTKVNTFTFYKGNRRGGGGGGGGGVNSPQKPKICKQNGGFTFFTTNIKYTGRKYISCIDVDSDSC